MLAFAIERSIATVFPRRYEKVRRNSGGWFLGIGAVSSFPTAARDV